MIKKAYFEITNVCNLNCSFCPGTKRKPGFVSVEDFTVAAKKINGKIQYLYLHLMGEPTIHPCFDDILRISGELGFKVIITTNGTTLRESGATLLSHECVYKVSISLHSFEANDNARTSDMDRYLNDCFEFCAKASEKGIISVMRLWNLDGVDTVGENDQNGNILAQMKRYFDTEWVTTRSGMRVADRVFLEYGERFDWPDDKRIEVPTDGSEDFFCYGLRDQIGILCDGSVVPCCLDSEGNICLGNLFESSLEDILNSEKARNFYDSVTKRKAPHPLCRTCGYAKRFKKN